MTISAYRCSCVAPQPPASLFAFTWWAVAMTAVLPHDSGGRRVVHVSPRADNSTGDGSASRPFALKAAVRALRGRAAGATVLLEGGDYFLSEPLVLTAADGGSQAHPVTYRSLHHSSSSDSTSPPDTTGAARLLGGVEVPWQAFKPVVPSAVPGLLVAELAPLGIRNASVLGGRGGDGLKAELYRSSRGGEGATGVTPQQLAMDPNPNPDGKWNWVGYDDIVGGSGAWFLMNNTGDPARAKRWQAAARSGGGFALFGHWGDEGGVSDAGVQSVVPAAASGKCVVNITLTSVPCSSRCDGFRVKAGERFVAVGALQFVDKPGEYWIDRKTLRLYYIPSASMSSGRLFLSTSPSLASPQASYKHPQALVQLQGTSWISWVGIAVVVSTQSLLSASSVTGVQLQDSLFQASGALGVSLDGNFSTISGCEFAHSASTALSVSGGNWCKRNPTLFVSAEVVVRNNTFYDWARWQRTPNSPALSWSGVGHLVSENVFRDAPEPAVLGNGNVDCVFEHNQIRNVNWEQSDMGAYYHGSASGGYNFAWTQPGNIIRANTWSDIRMQEQRATEGEKFTTQAIYMDDEQSSYTIVDNIFTDVDVGVLIGGGRRHTVTNNTFRSCGTACIHVDNRGMNWAHELCGCQCAFGTCVPGCHSGAAIGPGLAANLTASSPGFRFEVGLKELWGPILLNKAGMEWLPNWRNDSAGGGPCAPAHNIFRGNWFHKDGCNPPWQICGDPHNASRYHHNCNPKSQLNLEELQIWGSIATNNKYYSESGTGLPVMPWPVRDRTSPEIFTQNLVNWDIGYYGNESQLLDAINRSDPDIFSWDFGSENNHMHSLTSRGILASSHQSHEWQQTSGGPDFNTEFHRNFVSNGFGVDEAGELEPLHEDRGNLSAFMSQLAPKWHALTKEADVRAVAYGQTVTQDNVGNYYGVFHEGGGPEGGSSVILPQSQMPFGGGFSWGPWINHKFVRAYELRAHSIDSLPPLPNGSDFTLVEHVATQRAHGLTPIELTREPILHEYIRFTQNQTVERWIDLRQAAKAQAAKEKAPYPLGVYGNLECMAFKAKDACAWSQNRQPIMTAPWVDVIVLEAAMTIPEFKVALAAGNFEKIVFPFPDTCADPCAGGSALARALGATPAAGTSHARWYADHRHLFTDRRSVADIAVLLDLPVFFWRGFSSLAIPGDAPHVLAMQNVTALLDEEHAPYDILFEGHPDFYDDTKHWARLFSYRTLVLPRVESISDAHVEQIRHFAAGGGRVVVLGDTSGNTDEEDYIRDLPAFDVLRRQGLVSWVNDTVFSAFMANRTGLQRQAISDALGLNDNPLITTNAPRSVAVAAWLHGQGPMVSIQMANAGKHDLPVNTTIALSIRFADGDYYIPAEQLEVQFSSWSTPGGQPVALPTISSAGRINVTIPAFTRFCAVTLAVKGELKSRTEAGLLRKLTERLDLASTVTPTIRSASCIQKTAQLLAQSRSLLRSVQGPHSVALNISFTQRIPLQMAQKSTQIRAALHSVRTELIAATSRNRLETRNASGMVQIDFSASAAPSPPGWIRVGPRTAYQHGTIGWVEPASIVYSNPAPQILARKGAGGVPPPCPFGPEDAVLCSYLFGNNTQRSSLRVTLPRAGNFSVEIVMGEPSAMVTRVATTNVWSESGDLLAIGHRMPVQGEFTSLAFLISVPMPAAGEHPVLSLSLGGMAVSQYFEFDDRSSAGHGNSSHYFSLAWLANALIIRDSEQRLSSAALQSLRSHAVVAAGIRDWLILGPLDDSNATCLDNPTMTGSEPLPSKLLNISGFYTAKGGGTATWKRTALHGPLAHLDFLTHGPFHDTELWGASALAMTHLHNGKNTPQRVTLVSSTAGVGLGWLGMDEVFRDQLNTGLLVEEEKTEVVLMPGWNSLLIRSCTNWGAHGWGLWAAIRSLNGNAVETVTVDACGPLNGDMC